tara:strand:- start:694 stop:993 length:300 start_codon:yes stop_codon:yes gene_type:complete
MSVKKSRKNRKRNLKQGSIRPARTENGSDDKFSTESIVSNDKESIDAFLNEDQLNEKSLISSSPREERIVNDAIRDLRRTALTGGITVLGLVSFIALFS